MTMPVWCVRAPAPAYRRRLLIAQVHFASARKGKAMTAVVS